MHATSQELLAARSVIELAPSAVGRLEMIVRRPGEGLREVLEEGELDLEVGLVGDDWRIRGSRRTPDGSSHPDMQLNLMGSRVLDAVARGDRSRWALAGDQLVVDLDLRPESVPVGTHLQIGDTAVVVVTDQPHRGCVKFSDRFGVEALAFVNTGAGAAARYRGVNARVVVPGTVRTGDVVRTRPAPAGG